jgi:REP element-mobilizing transposase RayT
MGAVCTNHFGRGNRAPTGICDVRTNCVPLGKVIAFFKYQSTKQCNDFQDNETRQKLWQRNYYEHIIRDEHELHFIQEYIKGNPLKWNEHIM